MMKCSVCVFLCLSFVVEGSNILAVFPSLSKSHFVVFEALLKGLVTRGHNVTVVTTFPQKLPIPNWKDINVSPARTVLLNNLLMEYISVVPESFFYSLPKINFYISEIKNVLNSTDIVDLISSNVSYDLIIYEMFMDDVFLGFAHKFKAPVIAFGSCYMFPWVADIFAIPDNPSYIPGFYSGSNKSMPFYGRLYNTFINIICKLFYKFSFEPKLTEILRKYFGNTTPPVHELAKNISLYFINTHFSMFGSRPFTNQVVDISGIHLKSSRPLSQELDKWMNESADGVIYFSFGSMLRGATLPADKVKAFLQVFKMLPQRVLWKWEDDTVEGLPSNVKIMKWLPQRDILAHPKVKVFISHGGLLGITEAVVSGIPILGIPMYGDQPNNVAALVENGVAIHIDYNNISVASLSYALDSLLHDKSYSDNAKLLAERFLDRPQSPLDTAVYWTEYVIRHRGAPHLQSAAVHLPWYQYYLLDVAAVFLTALLIVLALIYYAIRSCLRYMCFRKSTKLKAN